MMDKALGIDIGGTGIKGGIVDLKTGELLTERVKFLTPKPATPDAVIRETLKLVDFFEWKKGPIGIGFPSIIKHGHSLSASNIDKKWINYPITDSFSKALNRKVTILNDADAAGLAEIKFGAGKDVKGTVLLVTLGTGLGSALFLDGKLIPNTEFGQLHYKHSITEHYASNKHRQENKMSWKSWGTSLNSVLKYIDFLVNPNLIILGGGVSKKFDSFAPFLKISTPIVPAQMLNGAGTIGAALATKLNK
jgi:polyphosphate glucokinase